jgi:hypothetical protein
MSAVMGHLSTIKSIQTQSAKTFFRGKEPAKRPRSIEE